MSEFLFNENKLFFILKYGIDDDFLIYEILPPFDEDKALTHNLVTLGYTEVSVNLKFPLSEDQIERLIHHQYNYFYDFYTQLLNRDYVTGQLVSQRG